MYVFHHGAGSSGLSFALVAFHLKTSISAGVIAFDVRHHGATTVNEGKEWNLSLETLAQDEIDVVKGVAIHASWDSRTEGWPDLILVGHRSFLLMVVLMIAWEVQCPHISPPTVFFRLYV